MFDYVGRDPDEGSARRRAESSLYTLLLVGFLGTAAGMIAAMAIRDLPPPDDDCCILIDPIVDEEIAVAMPGPPPLPAGRATGSADAPSESDDPVEPDELKPIPDKPVVKESEEAQGHEFGTVDGKPDGRQGGQGEEGTCEGPLCGGGSLRGKVVSPRLRRRVEPVYPFEARKLGIESAKCRVVVDVTPKGRAASVEVSGCPEVFHAETRRAMFRSRWAPFASPAGTTAPFIVRIRYTLDAAD